MLACKIHKLADVFAERKFTKYFFMKIFSVTTANTSLRNKNYQLLANPKWHNCHYNPSDIAISNHYNNPYNPPKNPFTYPYNNP